MGWYKGLIQIPDGFANPPVESFRWTRLQGGAIAIKYQGRYGDLLNKGATLTDEFDSIEISRQEGSDFYQLVAAQSATETVELHEISGTNLTQNKTQNDVLWGIIADSGAYDPNEFIAFVYNQAKTYQSDSNPVWTDYTERIKDHADQVIIIADPTALEENGVQLFEDLVLRGEDFLQVRYVYRHTVCMADRVWNGSVFSWPYMNVGRIHSEADLINAESIPPNFFLPKAISTGEGAEWLKQATQAALTMGQKRSLTMEYLSADYWSRLYYYPLS